MATAGVQQLPLQTWAPMALAGGRFVLVRREDFGTFMASATAHGLPETAPAAAATPAADNDVGVADGAQQVLVTYWSMDEALLHREPWLHRLVTLRLPHAPSTRAARHSGALTDRSPNTLTGDRTRVLSLLESLQVSRSSNGASGGARPAGMQGLGEVAALDELQVDSAACPHRPPCTGRSVHNGTCNGLRLHRCGSASGTTPW